MWHKATAQWSGTCSTSLQAAKTTLDLETTQAANQKDARATQHQSKVAGDCVFEQHHALSIIEDAPDTGEVGQNTQHETCIEPTAAVATITAADQTGTKNMALVSLILTMSLTRLHQQYHRLQTGRHYR